MYLCAILKISAAKTATIAKLPKRWLQFFKTHINMKQTPIFIVALFITIFGKTQNIDSIFAEPQIVELTISTPQPRLKEIFQISLDVNHLRANIFKSFAGKIQLSTDISVTDNDELTMNVTAIKKGKNEIGPLEFYLDKTKYTTNKITFEVIEPLPNTDKGVWLRKVMTSDSKFCIIIEQRIPAKNKTTYSTDNSISMTTEPEYNEILKFKETYSIEGLSGSSSNSSTNFSSVTIEGEERPFMYGYSVYYFNIKDKKDKIIITKDKFQNIPVDYKFDDIVIQ